jgi:hypothetical protein
MLAGTLLGRIKLDASMALSEKTTDLIEDRCHRQQHMELHGMNEKAKRKILEASMHITGSNRDNQRS